MKFQWTILVALLFAVLIAIFAVFNVDSVPVNFIFSTEMIPLVLIILGSALLGALISGFFAIYKSYSTGRRVKDLQKQLHLKEEEVSAQRIQMQEMEQSIDALSEPPLVQAEIIPPKELY